MPIRFRCKNCKKLLSIATRKAGQVVRCPACRAELSVPRLEEIVQKQQPARSPQPVRERETLEPSPPAPAPSDPPATDTALAEAPRPRIPEVGPDDEEGFTLRKSETEFEDMDLTPMVDVTFLLLIFFMITASFSLQKTIQVPPPDPDEKGAAQAMTLEELETDSIIVAIDEKNTIFVDDEPLSDPGQLIDKLLDKMRSEQKTELVLEADERALHEYVVKVVDAANDVGMQKIRLASRSGS